MSAPVARRGLVRTVSHASAPAICLAILSAAAMPASAASVETILHTFQGNENGNYPPFDGSYSVAGLRADSAGNYYGTTSFGGKGFGTVFKLTPDGNGGWSYKVICLLGDDVGQGFPQGPVAIDNQDHLYVTTVLDSMVGYGGVFELIPGKNDHWSVGKTFLFDDVGTNGLNGNGAKPQDGVTVDQAGNLFGTARIGGTTLGFPQSEGSGTVFELIPARDHWTPKALHRFRGDSRDGEFPFAGLIRDSSGDFYGAEPYGGKGSGTVFRMHEDAIGWKKTIIYALNTNKNGQMPESTLTFDAAGNIYGTTGSSLFKLTRPAKVNDKWVSTTLHTFTGGADGYGPSTVIFDAKGTLYGATGVGGNQPCQCGVVYSLTPTAKGPWTQTVLYTFTGGKDGGGPNGPLLLGQDGLLYGTTVSGGHVNPDGSTNGVVFSLTK